MNLLISPWVRRLVLAGVVVFAIWGFGAFKESQGYDRAKLECDLEISKIEAEQLVLSAIERRRQQQVNDDAKRYEAELINQNNQSSVELRQLLLEQSVESIKDSGASNSCLGASSVRRLNKVQ